MPTPTNPNPSPPTNRSLRGRTSPRKKAPTEPTLRRKCSSLLDHTFMMGEKFVRKEKAVLGNEIKSLAIHIMRLAIGIDSFHNRHRRMELYLAMDSDLKFARGTDSDIL